MTSRKTPEAPEWRRRSPRLQNVSASQIETQTSAKEIPKGALDETGRKKAATPESQTPAQQTSHSYGRIKSTLRSTAKLGMLGRTPGRSVRSTHYRTPKLNTVPWQRIAARTSVKKKDAERWDKDLKGLLKRSMKLCNLSSLANFKYQNERLRVKYEKTLKNKILEVYPSPLVVVKFKVTSCLSWQASRVDAVWLEVTSLVPGDTVEDDKMVIVYSAWLIQTKHIQSSNLKSINWLPVMLYTGRELIHQVVVDWLQGSFECYVARCGMRQGDLLWMTGICSRQRCHKPSHNLDDSKTEFVYSIIPPCGMSSFSSPNHRGRPRITIKLPLKDVHELWDQLMKNSNKQVSLEDLQKVLSAIDGVASQASGLPSSLLRLQEVRTPCVILANNGKVRLTCRKSMALVLHCFMDVFIQSTTCYDPDDYMEDLEKEDTIAELNNNSQ